MEMGKLTAKLRDAVPVCLLVEGKEIKRYRNIEIPDDIKKLEYQDFKFDVPLNGNITFKIMFAPGILPEELPQARERKTRKPTGQEAAQPQDAAPEIGAFAKTQMDPQAACDPVASIAVAITDEITNSETIEDEGGHLIIIAEPEATEVIPELVEAVTRASEVMVELEAKSQLENSEPAKKLGQKGKYKKGV